MTLGQKLKKARLDRGLTQAQVVGDRITRNMLSQLENDLASPSVGTLEYLASVLGVQAAWLLADEKEEEAAGRTERLRACYRGGDWAGCLELAQELQPDDEQALLLALAAAQCALHALEAERFAAAQQLARHDDGQVVALAGEPLHREHKAVERLAVVDVRERGVGGNPSAEPDAVEVTVHVVHLVR